MRLLGTAEPPAITRRRLERSVGCESTWRRTSFQIVGTPAAKLARSCSMKRERGSACRKRPGISRSAPSIQAAYGDPQALTWDMGTTMSRRGLALTLKARHYIIEGSNTDRWLLATPLGSPVVTVV